VTDNGTTQQVEGSVDHNVDRYPTLMQVCSRILDESELLESQVERVEINLFASGDATYRVFAPRSEEPEGGHWESLD
jgi:hypothetical protein